MNANREELLARMTSEEQDILHYGVLGMRWGHHKQQIAKAASSLNNKRKEVTQKLKERKQAKAEAKANSKSAIRKANRKANTPDNDGTTKRQDKANDKKIKDAYKKAYQNRDSMSNDDLKKLTERIKLENALQAEIAKSNEQKNKTKKEIAKLVLENGPKIIEATGKAFAQYNEGKNGSSKPSSSSASSSSGSSGKKKKGKMKAAKGMKWGKRKSNPTPKYPELPYNPKLIGYNG